MTGFLRKHAPEIVTTLLFLILLGLSAWIVKDYGTSRYMQGRAEVQEHFDAFRQKQTALVEQQQKDHAAQVQAATKDYQEKLANVKPQIITKRETVVRNVPVVVCVNPDGVRNFNDALASYRSASAAAR